MPAICSHHSPAFLYGKTTARRRVPSGVPAFALLCFAALLLVALHLPTQADAAEKKITPRTALVLATFGTTYEQSTDPLALVQAELKKRHPGIPQFVAYTSEHVVKTLRSRGKDARNLAQVLADLSADGYTHVVVQSLHVAPGKEFDLISETAGRFQHLPKGMAATEMGLPLIGTHEDAAAVADLLAANLPKERQPGDAVVFAGHGAEGPAGSLAYPALQSFLWEKDPNFFVGTIEGPYTLENILKAVQAKKAGKVWLVPLMTIVGDHARNDIFGDEADSWKQTFAKAGIAVTPVERGLLMTPGTAEIWANHADAALRGMEKRCNLAPEARGE